MAIMMANMPTQLAPTACGRMASNPSPARALSFRRSVGTNCAFVAARQQHKVSQRGSLQVQCALSRSRKVETVETLVKGLDTSALVFGIRFQNISVKEMQDFRLALPADAKIVICKNTLMKIAADKVEGWSDLKQASQGDNAWLFVGEECIAESVKAYLDFEKKLKDKLPKEERAAAKPTDISGGAMDGQFLTYEQVTKLKNLPNKLELIATIARLIKQVPTKVAIGIKQVPSKLAYGIKALADGDDDTSKIVGELFPKPETDAASA